MGWFKGKEAEFKVHINDVKRKQLPEIDDEFAKSVSQFETIDELKASLKQQMQLQALQQAEEAYHDALVNQAVANAKVDIPHEMVDQRIDEIVEEIKMNLESQNMSLDDYLKRMNQTECSSERKCHCKAGGYAVWHQNQPEWAGLLSVS